jgi:hypothetical protein
MEAEGRNNDETISKEKDQDVEMYLVCRFSEQMHPRLFLNLLLELDITVALCAVEPG